MTWKRRSYAFFWRLNDWRLLQEEEAEARRDLEEKSRNAEWDAYVQREMARMIKADSE